jgi:hypothetical protein
MYDQKHAVERGEGGRSYTSPSSPTPHFPADSQVNDDVNVFSPSQILLHGGVTVFDYVKSWRLTKKLRKINGGAL